jgi:hypothetical protein
MYKLSLKPKKNNPFRNQTIYWYPLLITPNKHLVSLNILTTDDSNRLDKLTEKGYVLFKYNISQENVCFIYHGSIIEELIYNFGERPFITDNGSINYFFSENELKYLFKENGVINETNNSAYLENYFRTEFSKIFGIEWYVNFSEKLNPYENGTNLIAPHPVLQLVNYTKEETFDKKYYKKMLIYLLHQNFLVEWVNPEKTSIEFDTVINECNKLSDREIKTAQDLKLDIEKAVSNLFTMHEVFQKLYLAVQCGTDNCTPKTLMKNLYNLLPQEKQNNIHLRYPRFQPKFTISSIELHFIKNTQTQSQLFVIYEWLKKISTNIKFYDILHHKMLSDEIHIIKAMRNHRADCRYRFICEVSITPWIDYSQLYLKVKELADAINTILKKRSFFDNSINEQTRNIKELWVKKIGLMIFTPPQFEDAVKYSLSQRWIINHSVENNQNDDKNKAKILSIDLFCDYPVFIEDKFSFSFDYLSDIQYVYETLNDRLKKKYDFHQFSLDFSESSDSKKS